MKNLRITLVASPFLCLAVACGGGDVNATSETEPDVYTELEELEELEDDALEAEDMQEEAMEALEEASEDVAEKKAEIEEQISGYEGTLAAKQKELEDLLTRIKGLSPTELMGAEGKQLKLDSESLQKVIDGLQSKIAAAKSQLGG